jgi:2'-5' RNA ligase
MPQPMSPPPLRLFLALWPDGATRQGLAAWRDAVSWPAGASTARTEGLHVTLHFIGAVPAARIEEIRTGLSRPVEPFTLLFGRAELWSQGIAVLCPHSTPPALARLHEELGDALRGLSLPVEDRPFRPHVTLARRARGAVLPASGPALEWSVNEGYALVQSLPGGQGYRVLQRFPAD